MPKLRPEVLFKDGKLIWDKWYNEIGEGTCCQGESCGKEETNGSRKQSVFSRNFPSDDNWTNEWKHLLHTE